MRTGHTILMTAPPRELATIITPAVTGPSRCEYIDWKIL
jgi:hypothetical protein